MSRPHRTDGGSVAAGRALLKLDARGRVWALCTVAIASLVLAHSPASAYAAPPKAPTCKVTSLPSFVEAGEEQLAGSVGDIVEVACEPADGFHRVEVSAPQLYARCKDALVWFAGHSPPRASPGATVKGVELDVDGNATVALLAGPGCQAGASLITADLETPPYESAQATFTVLAPKATAAGASALPSTEIEDANDSSVYALVAVGFPPVDAEDSVSLTAQQLFSRCVIPPHLVWMGPGPKVLGIGLEGVKVKLDDDGNAFALVFGEESCAGGVSLIEALLEASPFTRYSTTFTIRSPEPGF